MLECYAYPDLQSTAYKIKGPRIARSSVLKIPYAALLTILAARVRHQCCQLATSQCLRLSPCT
jgi:hypothetical protein